MGSSVIKVENLSKQYRLGQVGRATLHNDLNRWLHKAVGKPDPYLKIGEENDRTVKGDNAYLWALQNINFEVQQGEVLGIIGKNGAGKSTLLKILSKVTAPTTGSIKVKGRVASLLEVGTGFHPELSGRDNIFLNGAILGMRKKEIAGKLDEIVAFAGVERYLDTPVKRYSSGMYVRLAFAVAAHLEPDILIVDEVLAVGDAEFQKKCLGKMKDVSEKDGRTVLFVSHNMEAVIKLCVNCIFLKKGKIFIEGDTTKVINNYLKEDKYFEDVIDLKSQPRISNHQLHQNAKLQRVQLINSDKSWTLEYKKPLNFRFQIKVYKPLKNLELGIALYTLTEFEVASSLSSDYQVFGDVVTGDYNIEFRFVDFNLLPGLYKAGFGLRSENGFEDYLPFACMFEITVGMLSANEKSASRKGIIVPIINCCINQV